MKYRKKMPKNKSRRSFRKYAVKRNRRNEARPMRGGTRL